MSHYHLKLRLNFGIDEIIYLVKVILGLPANQSPEFSVAVEVRKFHWKLGSSPFLYKPVAVFQFVTLALWSAFHFISLSAP